MELKLCNIADLQIQTVLYFFGFQFNGFSRKNDVRQSGYSRLVSTCFDCGDFNEEYLLSKVLYQELLLKLPLQIFASLHLNSNN